MNIREVTAKTILRKYKTIDSWFISRYGMNLYRGCVHNCIYCDGRSEKYLVEGEFGHDIDVKVNAIELLRRELDPARKRKPFRASYFLMGGGVGDSYQAVERKYRLCRQALSLCLDFSHPVHLLTKSTSVAEDIGLIRKIHEKRGAIVSFSFSTVDEKLGRLLEPGVPSPKERLEVMALVKKEGIPCGMFLLPVVPFVTDTEDLIEASVKKAAEAGADFVIFGPMTMKRGRQGDYFMNTIRSSFPDIPEKYRAVYGNDEWGNPVSSYTDMVHGRVAPIASRYRMPLRIPIGLFDTLLDENDRVIVLLQHIDYLLKIRAQPSSFGYGAYLLSKLTKPFSSIKEEIDNMARLNKRVKQTVFEILRTGSSSLYRRLCHFELPVLRTRKG
ncbi:MAG: radical SAM protein [Spirochaetales bacterium]|nr:radical SAM protein [Spirochaetales bacterium]